MRTGKELILATKPYAVDSSARSWGHILSTAILLAAAVAGTLWYFPSVSFSENAAWTYDKAALESSSCLKAGPIVAWFTANIGYHHLHHLNSRIPFYRLPEVVAAIPELQTPKTTSLHPMETLRCLRLKVWDPEAKRMVSLGDMAKPIRAVGV